MLSVIRTLPGLAAAFVLGALVMSSDFAQATSTLKGCEVGIVLGAAVLATLFLLSMTRRRPQQQQAGGFGQQTRNRTRTGR